MLTALLEISELIPAESAQPFSAAIVLHDITDLLAIELAVQYDRTELHFEDAELAADFPAREQWAANLSVRHEPNQGRVSLSAFSSEPYSGSAADLIDLIFTPDADFVGESILALAADGNDTNLNEGQIPVDVQDGSALVTADDAAILRLPRGDVVGVGELATIHVRGENLANWQAADLVIAYNSTLLSAQSVAPTALTGNWTLDANLSTPGLIRVAMFGTPAVAGDGDILAITFQVSPNAPVGESTTIQWTTAILNEQAIRSAPVNGRIVFEEPAAATWTNPHDRYDVNDDGRVIPLDALLIINHLSRNNGVTPVPAPPATPPPYLDVSADGLVTPRDALLVINQIIRLFEGEGESLTVGGAAAWPVGWPAPAVRSASEHDAGLPEPAAQAIPEETAAPGDNTWLVPEAQRQDPRHHRQIVHLGVSSGASRRDLDGQLVDLGIAEPTTSLD